ncbi:2-C-methyl-D-erythritol 2,4-cyclodiphosphate synthase, partial [bacterium]|nr:2-C-methyl-D-erythritol 2,4-cyclodiphosphate synthase [bacterium]
DADVLLHAIMDALLGAAHLGDIGVHFPDTDPQWKGANSLSLTASVAGLLKEHGWEIVSIDSLIIAQRPKMSPHFSSMAENIAQALSIKPSQVSVKATTTEKLGFCGRGEGIAATASALLRRLPPW